MFFSSIGQGICDVFQMTRGNTVFFLTADGVSFHIMQKKLKQSHKKGYWGYLCSCGKWSRNIYFTLRVGNIHP